MCGVTRMDRVRNQYKRESLRVASITEKVKGNRLSWYRHVTRGDENHVTRRVEHECGRMERKRST
jgi:hypothetical protein